MLPSPAPVSHDSAALRCDIKQKKDFLGYLVADVDDYLTCGALIVSPGA
jgi:hypothetical protein